MRKNFLIGASVLGLALAALTGASAQIRLPLSFAATLTGLAERPEPVQTRSFGRATVKVDRRMHKMSVSVRVNRITDLVAAHIHRGGPDEAGPVVATLYGPAETVGLEAGELFTRTITAGDIDADALFGGKDAPPNGGFAATVDDLVDAMRAGQIYINLHTLAHPGGELRGQVLPTGGLFRD